LNYWFADFISVLGTTPNTGGVLESSTQSQRARRTAAENAEGSGLSANLRWRADCGEIGHHTKHGYGRYDSYLTKTAVLRLTKCEQERNYGRPSRSVPFDRRGL